MTYFNLQEWDKKIRIHDSCFQVVFGKRVIFFFSFPVLINAKVLYFKKQ